MFSSTNENIGFSAIGQEELETTNGGIGVLEAGLVAAGIGCLVGYTFATMKLPPPPKPSGK